MATPLPLPVPLPTVAEIVAALAALPPDTPIALTWALAMHEPRAVVLTDVVRRIRTAPVP